MHAAGCTRTVGGVKGLRGSLAFTGVTGAATLRRPMLVLARLTGHVSTRSLRSGLISPSSSSLSAPGSAAKQQQAIARS